MSALRCCRSIEIGLKTIEPSLIQIWDAISMGSFEGVEIGAYVSGESNFLGSVHSFVGTMPDHSARFNVRLPDAYLQTNMK
jgi:hypothetical protein